MHYESVDGLQEVLTRDVFHYAKDSKKAAGRALGTLVEIISFYLLRSWGLEKHTAIERRLPEYANPDIKHNVEFTLHPSFDVADLYVDRSELPLTAKKIVRLIPELQRLSADLKAIQLLSKDNVVRNACTLYESTDELIVARIGDTSRRTRRVYVNRLLPHPFAVVECKRVGVEEGVKKGPQTIEKAKQGAYVARTVSSLQKIRMPDGKIHGVLCTENGNLVCRPYGQFLDDVISSNDPAMLRGFTLTVGIVSNHGNWFTSDDHNKELKVLAQSYDWLLFLTDQGLTEFVETSLLRRSAEFKAVRAAFASSYTGRKGQNRFTKVQIDVAADAALRKFFVTRLESVQRWFNVISPDSRTIVQLKDELRALATKDWGGILG